MAERLGTVARDVPTRQNGAMAGVDPLETVERLITAIETGAVDEYRALYAPDAVIWTCFDDRERNVDGSVGVGLNTPMNAFCVSSCLV